MRKKLFAAAFAGAMLAGAGVAALAQAGKAPAADWHMNATIIEACSCPMFCQCYFNMEPAEHTGHQGHGGGGHFCKFNNAYKVNKGNYGSVKLDGAKFWASGDLGGDFSKGKMDWAVLTFDKATTPEQRQAIQTIVGRLMPVTWNSFTTAEGDISWTASATQAHALLDGGKTAEVKLQANPTAMNKSEPTVIKNLTYWGAPRNDGFVLMPNIVEAYRVGPKAYEYKGSNGFMITFDIDSKTAPAAPAGQ
jgi:hypothetical protein